MQKKANNFSLALRALRATIAPAALGRTLNAQRAANKRLCALGRPKKVVSAVPMPLARN